MACNCGVCQECNWARSHEEFGGDEDVRDAEITRLKAKLQEAQDVAAHHIRLAEENAKDEITRLRAELEEARRLLGEWYDYETVGGPELRRNTYAALHPAEPKEGE